MHGLRVCELFCGIGGFRHGLEKASTQFETVFANELDKWAASIYRHHWNDGSLCEGDIRSIQAKDLPDFDILCGGFPCQPFSSAGKRSEFRDPRGTLIYEIIRLAKEKQPKMLLLENVPGLLVFSREKLSKRSLRRWGNWGIFASGRFLTANFSEYHNPVAESSLSHILLPSSMVEERFFLSETATQWVLNRVKGKFAVHLLQAMAVCMEAIPT